MGKSNYDLDEAKIKQRQKEGRGKGEKENYIPWIFVQDVPSWGNSTRLTGWKAIRDCHLLSTLELMFFYLLEFCSFVLDVREQYPLLNRDFARSIARDLKVPYPTDPKTRIGIVMTLDFLITVRLENGEEAIIARTVKPKNQITQRVVEKFQIEQIYVFEELGVKDWGIWTKDELPQAFADNVKLIHPRRHLKQLQLKEPDSLPEIAFDLTRRILDNERPLRFVTSEYDLEKKYENGTALAVAYHLIANHIWKIDMFQRINTNRPLKLLNADELVD